MDFSTVKPYLLKVLPYLIALVIGVAIGWEMKPDQVRIEEKIVEKVKTEEKKVVDETLVQAEVDKRVKEIQANMKTKTVTVWVEKPDHTKTVTSTTETENNTKTTENETKTTDTTATKKEVVEKIVYRDVETVKIVEPVKAQWMVGVGVGVAPRFDNPATTPIIISVSAKRRIIGPFFLGLQVQAGSPVTVFNVTNATGIISVDAEF